MDVDAERLFEIRDEFDRAAQRYQDAANSTGPQRGVDPSGHVSATRASLSEPWRIEVDSLWKSSLASSELSQAVLTAVITAVGAVVGILASIGGAMANLVSQGSSSKATLQETRVRASWPQLAI
jgi:hypothetical protein